MRFAFRRPHVWVDDGEELPRWYYGVVGYYPSRRSTLFVPIPLNILVRLRIELCVRWDRLRSGGSDSWIRATEAERLCRDKQAKSFERGLAQGRAEGQRTGYEEGRRDVLLMVKGIMERTHG